MKTVVVTANDDRGLDGEIAMHFGHCPFFVIARIGDDGAIDGTEVIANPFAENHEPGQIPKHLQSLGANIVIAGGMGARAIEWFNQLGIDVAAGRAGSIRASLDAYIAGELSDVVTCDHDHPHT